MNGGGDALFRKLMIHQTVHFEIPLIKYTGGEVVFYTVRHTVRIMKYYNIIMVCTCSEL